MKHLFVFFFLFIANACNQSPALPVQQEQPKRGGKVIAVKDGDTIDILTRDQFVISIRLDEIDCPEKSQAFGKAAKQFTSDFCFGKFVTVKGSKKDGYGRLLAYIYNEKGQCLNEALLNNGLAWQYTQYSKSVNLQTLEANARAKRAGLWADARPVAPWAYRTAAKSKKKNAKI